MRRYEADAEGERPIAHQDLMFRADGWLLDQLERDLTPSLPSEDPREGLVDIRCGKCGMAHYEVVDCISALRTALAEEREAREKYEKRAEQFAATIEDLSRRAEQAEAEVKRWRERAERADAAIDWALGEGDSDFGDNKPKRPDGTVAPYWWRTELRKRAGR